ncbi:MAG: thiolase domain-containing protein [Acidimicrobiales bacterium]|nr:thiolase domain-containing protein [Acidimicrobiales bacterium]MCB1259526.1 thiolase domain-containing protein [Acidimicrobiales bacterium]
MRDIAIISFAQTHHARAIEQENEVEMLQPVVVDAIAKAGITKDRIDFVCSGSADYLAGMAFSFVLTLDAVGPWPPISESHVDMDAAWAVYEAWVKMQMGKADIALIYGYGKSSPGNIRRALTRQLDPYTLQPLWADPVSLAAIQARSALDTGTVTTEAMAEVAARSWRSAQDNPYAQLKGDLAAADVLATEPFVDPLRRHDCAPITDGAAAVVLAAGDVARELCERPAWIRGIDHRIEPHMLGVRDLTTSASTAIAAAKAGVGDGPIDVAELHAPFSHQELILAAALGLGDDTAINPSGGALCANPVMTAGLVRMGEVAQRVIDGTADRGVAHATSGACLQQNLVCVLEGE